MTWQELVLSGRHWPEVTAQRMHVPYGCREEAITAAWEGLISAAKKFDPERGVKFMNYALIFIRGRVTRVMLKHRRRIGSECLESAVAVHGTTRDEPQVAVEVNSILNRLSPLDRQTLVDRFLLDRNTAELASKPSTGSHRLTRALRRAREVA